MKYIYHRKKKNTNHKTCSFLLKLEYQRDIDSLTWGFYDSHLMDKWICLEAIQSINLLHDGSEFLDGTILEYHASTDHLARYPYRPWASYKTKGKIAKGKSWGIKENEPLSKTGSIHWSPKPHVYRKKNNDPHSIYSTNRFH